MIIYNIIILLAVLAVGYLVPAYLFNKKALPVLGGKMFSLTNPLNQLSLLISLCLTFVAALLIFSPNYRTLTINENKYLIKEIETENENLVPYYFDGEFLYCTDTSTGLISVMTANGKEILAAEAGEYERYGDIFRLQTSETDIRYFDLKGNPLENLKGEYVFKYGNKLTLMQESVTEDIYVLDNNGEIVDIASKGTETGSTPLRLKSLGLGSDDIFMIDNRYIPVVFATEEGYTISLYDTKNSEMIDTDYFMLAGTQDGKTLVYDKETIQMNLVDKKFNNIFEENQPDIRFADDRNKLIVTSDVSYSISDLAGKEILNLSENTIDVNVNDSGIILATVEAPNEAMESESRDILLDMDGNELYSFEKGMFNVMNGDFIFSPEFFSNDTEATVELCYYADGDLVKYADVDYFAAYPYINTTSLNGGNFAYVMDGKIYVVQKI